jgi:RNA polymerase sigma factor (sigma-70 family)
MDDCAAQETVSAFTQDAPNSGFTENQWNRVHAACLRRLSDWHLAEEATQAVFVLALRKHDAQHALAENSGWLMRAADLVCRETLRRERRRRYHEHVAGKSHSAVESKSSIQNDESQNLETELNIALESLSDGDRTILKQRFFARQPYRSIGNLLGLSEAAVEKRVSRALARLRQNLKSRRIDINTAALPLLLYAAVEAASGGSSVLRRFHFTRENQRLANRALRKLAWKNAALAAAAIATVLIFFPLSQHYFPRNTVTAPFVPPVQVTAIGERSVSSVADAEPQQNAMITPAPVENSESPNAVAKNSNHGSSSSADDGTVIAMRSVSPGEAQPTMIVPTSEKFAAAMVEEDAIIAAAGHGKTQAAAARPISVSKEAVAAHGVIVKAIDLNMAADSSTARSELIFTFENHSDRAAEFSFVFAVPENAAADRLAISGTNEGEIFEAEAAYVADARAAYMKAQNARMEPLPANDGMVCSTLTLRSPDANPHALAFKPKQQFPAHTALETWALPEASRRELGELLVQAELPPIVPRRKWERLQPRPEDPLAGVLERIEANLYRLTISSIPAWRTRKVLVSCVHPLALENSITGIRSIYRFPFLDLSLLTPAPMLHFHGVLRDVEDTASLQAPPGALVSRLKDALVIELNPGQTNCGELRVEFCGKVGRLLAGGDCVFQLHRPDAKTHSEDRFSLTFPPCPATTNARQPTDTTVRNAELIVTAADGKVVTTSGQHAAELPLDRSLTVYGIGNLSGPVTVVLTGTIGDAPFRRKWTAVLPGKPVRNVTIAKLWARSQQAPLDSTPAALQQHILNGPIAFVVAPALNSKSRTAEVQNGAGNSELIVASPVK